MINKWKVKNALEFSERVKIKEAIDLNMTYREMAEYVGRPKSTVMREAKRLGTFEIYDPKKAQEDFERKQDKWIAQTTKKAR